MKVELVSEMDESNIPIAINTSKLLDWLISRRHVNKDWAGNILSVREKINAAIQDMPEHKEILKLLSGQHINYFHCLRIVEILKETEKDSKNMFGRYGSQRMKDWNDILSLYQRDNLYLAEAAQIVIRNVNFEVPSLKKQVQKLEQTQLESEKKIKDYSKAESIAQNEFANSCKQLGIEGVSIKKELLKLLAELPNIYEKGAKNIKQVEPAIELYEALVQFHLGKKHDSNLLPMLKYLINYGNTTTYEYVYGEKPISIEEPTILTDNEEKHDGNSGAEIDFGDGLINYGENQIDVRFNSNTIDFGDGAEIDLSGITVSEGEIDFGAPSSSEEGFEIIEHDDINLEESGIVVEKSGNDGGIARDSDAFTIMDNPKTRDQIINDLMELETFLKMRIYEMSVDSDLLSMSQIDAPTVVQMQTIEGITKLKDGVELALNELTNKRTQHLHNVKHSEKYVDILTASLKQKLSIVDRMEASKKLLQQKIADVREEGVKLQPVIAKIIEQTRTLQKQIEEDISKKYKGRKVNITGGVNIL